MSSAVVERAELIEQVTRDYGTYAVWKVRIPNLPYDTYAVVNAATSVIEDMQPNLYNAISIAKQMDEWLAAENFHGESNDASFN